MQTSDIIKSGMAYIEDNLKADVTAAELADMAGYSLWHYHRLFAGEVGMPVAAYIGKRRLDRALAEIAGGRRAVDAALEYGFDTYAGFYKAFRRMYGGSPKNYLSKMEATKMFTEKELRDILTNWDIPNDLPILDVYIMDGTRAAGNVWAVGEDYILKTFVSENDREMYFKNLKLAKALAARGFAASTPVPLKSGEEYLEGEKIFVLTRGVSGCPLSKSERFGENRREFGRKYGKGLARLHKALMDIEGDMQPDEKNLLQDVIGWALPKVCEMNARLKMGLPESFFEDYTGSFGALFDELPKQLVHGDPNPCNILFDGGEVTGFINFDWYARNIRLWDICYCSTGILSEWRGVGGIYEKWPSILEGILQGYDSVNPLTEAEKQAVFYVLCSIQMTCVAHFDSLEGYEELAKTNREMLKLIVENEAKIKQIF